MLLWELLSVQTLEEARSAEPASTGWKVLFAVAENHQRWSMWNCIETNEVSAISFEGKQLQTQRTWIMFMSSGQQIMTANSSAVGLP